MEEPNKPLISVIVPIFNVEKYMRRCLDSLANQTMKQIEIICIDDGSTDRSGIIADQYTTVEGQWPHFKVIHTENRGLSAARNTGINEAKADFLMFVDSDDWVDKNFCRIPYKSAININADMVIFQARSWKKGWSKNRKDAQIPKGLVDEFSAHYYGGATAWNRLYSRKLIGEIRYPEGRLCEDRAVTHKIVHNASRIVVLEDCLYTHVNRKGSITHERTSKYRKEYLISALERYEDLRSYGFPDEYLTNSLNIATIGYLVCTQSEGEALYEKARELVNRIDEIPNSISWKKRIALRSWKIDKRLFHMLCQVTGRMND